MSIFEAPMLPSPALRTHYAFEVAARVEKVKASLQVAMLDGLGDLALALAHRPIRQWAGHVDELAQIMAPRWSRPEASAVVEIAAKVGLLVPWQGDQLRPKDIGHMMWLGARRVATTNDQDQLFEWRLNGALFDVFAMVPSLMTDREAAKELVRSFADRETPWEDIVEAGAALAAAAVAWGAPVEDELRYRLLARAEDWVMPMGSDQHRETGTALLAQEAKAGPFREEVINLAMVRLKELVSDALTDEEMAEHPAVVGCLRTQIGIVLAGFGPSPETIASIIAELPPTHAHMVGEALCNIMEPGEGRNEALVDAALQALAREDVNALAPLSGLVEPLAGVIGPIHDLFQRVLENPPGELTTVYQGMAACRAIGHWEACPELTLHLLAKVVASSVDPDLRISAAEALSKHIDHLGRAHEILLQTLDLQIDIVDRATAIAACACALHLGSPRLRLAAIALAFIADDGPIDILANAIDAGVRRFPMHFAAFEETVAHYATDDTMRGAALAVMARIALRLQEEYELGPFFTLPHHDPIIRAGMARLLLPMVADIAKPHFSGDAATACAWVLRGDPAYALTCLTMYDQATDDRLRAMYDLAMGATGVRDPQVLERLGRDCAHGPPELSAAAAVALRVLFEGVDDGALIEGYLPTMRARVDLAGPQQEPIRQLFFQLATMPYMA